MPPTDHLRRGVTWNDCERADLAGGYFIEMISIIQLMTRHQRSGSGITSELIKIMSTKSKCQTLVKEARARSKMLSVWTPLQTQGELFNKVIANST